MARRRTAAPGPARADRGVCLWQPDPGTGRAGPDSDLDLAVLVAAYAQPLQLWQLAGELCDRLGLAVDLLDLRAASTVMQHQVLITGRRLWGDALAAGLFECYVLSEKTALNEARRGLLEDIGKDGRVYGRQP